MQTYRTLALALTLTISLPMAGCAITGVTGGLPTSIIVTKKPDPTSPHCKVTVEIYNRMRSAWIGVSYLVVLRDASGRPLGELQGVPTRYTETGYGIVVEQIVTAVKCNDIASASVQYFGYYPANGGGQIRIPNSSVSAEIK